MEARPVDMGAIGVVLSPSDDAADRGHPLDAVSPARAQLVRQRRRRRRVLIALTGLTALCTFAVGLVDVYVQTRLRQIRRVALPSLAEDTPGAVMNVLLVGSDSRANLVGTDAVAFGQDQVSGGRSDTMMVLHLDPKQQQAAIVSVPRDLYVPIAGTSYSDRVNTAFAVGGANQLVATVERALGITLNHYIEVDFAGFKDIVDTVGGVTIYVPYPVRDAGSGLDFGREGCFVMTGQQALSWVRSRYVEFLIDGTWRRDPRSDLGRIERQQDFIRRMMRKAISSGLSNPIQLNRLIGIGVRDVTFDAALSTSDIATLARRFRSLDPSRVALRTLPTDPVDIDGKAVLKLQSAQAKPMIDLLNGTAPIEVTPTTVASTGPSSTAGAATPPTTAALGAASTVRPADVKVRVLNGVGTPGAAGMAAAGLSGSGFVVTEKADAPALAAKTLISYGSGQLAKAQRVESVLLSPAMLKEDQSLRGADVSLLLGADYTGLRPPGSTSSTTAPAAPFVTSTTLDQISPVPLRKDTTAPPC